jgi:hypothetical protein
LGSTGCNDDDDTEVCEDAKGRSLRIHVVGTKADKLQEMTYRVACSPGWLSLLILTIVADRTAACAAVPAVQQHSCSSLKVVDMSTMWTRVSHRGTSGEGRRQPIWFQASRRTEGQRPSVRNGMTMGNLVCPMSSLNRPLDWFGNFGRHRRSALYVQMMMIRADAEGYRDSSR